jgi:hypothetical protein
MGNYIRRLSKTIKGDPKKQVEVLSRNYQKMYEDEVIKVKMLETSEKRAKHDADVAKSFSIESNRKNGVITMENSRLRHELYKYQNF